MPSAHGGQRILGHADIVIVRELGDSDRSWVHRLVESEWGLPVVSTSGNYDPSTLPGFVAEQDGERIGVLTYRLAAGECEIVTLNSLREGLGAGSVLLATARRLAEERALRLWLITTNDNIRALRFYQRRGMDMRAIHRDFVDTVRRHKPFGPDDRAGEIAFRHAIEFSY